MNLTFYLVLIMTHGVFWVQAIPNALLRELQENFGIFGDRIVEAGPKGGRRTLQDDRDERNQEIEELRKLMKEISRLAQHKFFNKDREDKKNARDDNGEGEEQIYKQAIGHPGFRAQSPLADTLFEGDILLTPSQAKYILLSLQSSIRNAERSLRLGVRHRVKRKMYKNEDSRWVSFPIQYTYDTDLSEDARTQVKAALDFWGGSTCLSYQRSTRTPKGDYLQFFKGEGCYSMIGRVGGKQGISIGNGCERIGVTAHEIGHAMGLWHEQSRPDSDCCIKLIKGNIIERMISNFLSRTWTDTVAYGIPYDLGSVMHYGPTAFTKDWSKITIETKQPGFQRTIGQRNYPSFYDVKVINEAYCSHICSKSHKCERGGYPHPTNCKECICPDGLGGTHCEKNEQAQRAQCGSVVDLSDGKVREIRSPGYPNPGYGPGMKCNWLFKTPHGRRIVLKFVDQFQFMCMTTCMDYVEIKNATDLANTGMRYCCYTKPEGLIYSEGHEMIIIFKAEVNRDVGFKLRVQMSKKLGTIEPSTPRPTTPWIPVIPTLFSSSTTDAVTTPTTTTRRRTTTRYTTPSSTLYYTTPNPPTTEGPVTGSWSAWAAWGYCSRTCGACGVKTRRRLCINGGCDRGDKEQYRRCNFNVCPGDALCSKQSTVDNTAWGPRLLQSSGQSDSYSFKCQLPSCCPPFKAVGTECRLGLMNDAVPKWRPWSKWTACIGPPCGGCAISTRTRICNDYQCKGRNFESKRCNAKPCKTCSAQSKRSMLNAACGASAKLCAMQSIITRENYDCPCCKPLKLKNNTCTI